MFRMIYRPRNRQKRPSQETHDLHGNGSDRLNINRDRPAQTEGDPEFQALAY
jgi:hypothetical protein